MFKITLILKLVWDIINYFLLSEMAEQQSHTYLQMQSLNLQLTKDVEADGISLENLPSSLLQGNFLEFDENSPGKEVSKF